MIDPESRGMTSVVGIILLVAVTVVVAATVATVAFDLGSDVQQNAPYIETSFELVDDGTEQTIAVTFVAGEPVAIDRLYVTGSKDFDIGGPPNSGTPADEQWASSREKFSESNNNNPPQVGIGDTWEAGETVYLDPVGDVENVTVSIYWVSRSVEGVNPGTPEGDDSYLLDRLTVGSSA